MFFFAAIFPFFNNVDEQAHFDLVIRYAHGEIPRSLGLMKPESAHYFTLFGSPEYFMAPEQSGDRPLPRPLWRRPPEAARLTYDRTVALWEKQTNHEASSPPLYYLVAAAWLWLGRLARLSEFSQLYWIRVLDVFAAVGLVWLGFVAARLVFPDRRWLWRGVPLLLAFFPQDALYSIQSDVLSPLCFGAAFIALVKWMRAAPPSVRLGIATGAALAATYLTKSGNIPLLGVSALTVSWTTWRWIKTARFRTGWRALLALVLCTGLPIGAWMIWCRSQFGDVTGSAAKIQILGWTQKPFLEWWSHPVFTPSGAWAFLSELLASFWRGEFVWRLARLASPPMDWFYAISSVLFVGLALDGLRRKAVNPEQRQALWLAFWCFLASVTFLTVLSVAFDFGSCYYPSRSHPYFTSGRLMAGALIPFALFYAWGLDCGLRWIRSEQLALAVLAAIMLLVTVSEIRINSVAFSSEYSWFNALGTVRAQAEIAPR